MGFLGKWNFSFISSTEKGNIFIESYGGEFAHENYILRGSINFSSRQPILFFK